MLKNKQEILSYLREQRHWISIREEKDWLGIFHFGSYNYNLADDKSDVDCRYIVFDEEPIREYINEVGEHIEVVNFNEFIRGVLGGQLTFIETIATELYFINPLYMEDWKIIHSLIENLAASLAPNIFNNFPEWGKEVVDGFLRNLTEDPLGQVLGFPPKRISHMKRAIIITERLVNKQYSNLFILTEEDIVEHKLIKRGIKFSDKREAKKVIQLDYKILVEKSKHKFDKVPAIPRNFFRAVYNIRTKHNMQIKQGGQ